MATELQTAAAQLQSAGARSTHAAGSRRLRPRRAVVYLQEKRADGFSLRRVCARVLRVTCALVVVSVIATTAAFAYLYSHYSKIVDERLANGYLTSRAGIYAAPRTLRAGQKLTAVRLAEILRRAGYVEGEASRVWNGRFRVEDDAVEILPSETSSSSAEASGSSTPNVVRVEFDRRGQISKLSGDGVPLDSYTLAPEPLTSDAAEKTSDRAALSYEEIPETLRRAILSIEDRRFFEHGPVDLWGVARAAFSWGDDEQTLKQGGSTITQQLVKNTYLTPERTLARKFREAALAAVLESRIGKRDIFALYCNEIYLGRRGSVSVRGVRQAARVFFGKELKDLSLAESATIAGMIQSPARFAPDRHAEEARARRNVVLGAMLRDDAVSVDEARAAADEPVSVAPFERTDAVAPYFIDYVNRETEARLPDDGQGAAGARVYTTLDLELQGIAEEALARQVERLEKTFKGKRRPQAALVALDPHTGDVLAMVGGTSYAESQLNRATDARRQPGSVFKPVVYAAALEAGLSPLTLSADAPREFTYDGRARYRPANYGGGYSMRDVTLREGLVRSLNVVTVDAALRVGMARVASLAERLGLPRPQAYPSSALGASEATPLEVATAYTAFAAGGRVARPNPFVRVEGVGGASETLKEQPARSETLDARADDSGQVLKPATAFMLTDMLSAVIDHGTARAARGMLKGAAVAGKTGTSRDGWFAGFTPNLVCVVYVGFDDGEELGLTGADAALPAWSEFVRRAVELRPELGGAAFEQPASVAYVDVDPETGLLAAPACPRRERVALTPAFAPDHECSLHGDPWGLLALAATPAPAAPTTTQTEARASRPYESISETSPRSSERSTLPLAEQSRETYVEVNRDGQRTLKNDLRVVPATKE
ncbi:MAG TPA: PBP1A family penicillin-binding protein [Pyrinomonadaceae bacterium]|nr:PBP1A family penicillin-binding protein [Pyrinomonadaceae bacterium]